MNSIIVFIFLSLLFAMSPFCGLVVSFFLLYNRKQSKHSTTYCLFFISLFWGILAYTQKSLAQINTDVIRYYAICETWEKMTPVEAVQDALSENPLNFIFYLVSAFLTAIIKNVQIICLFWVTLTYILSYLSIKKLMKYYGCYEQRQFAHIVLLMTFCFMCFVQISELLKNASAFAVFFYGFSYFIEKGWGWRSLLLLILAVGIHPSALMLVPLFFYKKIDTQKLLIIACISVFPALVFNVQAMIISHFPIQFAYFLLIAEHFGNSTEHGTGTMHYTGILLAMFASGILVWIKSGRKNNETCNIIFLYFIVSLFNYINLISYLRLALFSHFLFGMLLVQFVRLHSKRWDIAVKLIIVFMCFMTLRFSYSRTLSGEYCSSYMDNSLTKIIFSNSIEYLDIRYDRL